MRPSLGLMCGPTSGRAGLSRYPSARSSFNFSLPFGLFFHSACCHRRCFTAIVTVCARYHPTTCALPFCPHLPLVHALHQFRLAYACLTLHHCSSFSTWPMHAPLLLIQPMHTSSAACPCSSVSIPLHHRCTSCWPSMHASACMQPYACLMLCRLCVPYQHNLVHDCALCRIACAYPFPMHALLSPVHTWCPH